MTHADDWESHWTEYADSASNNPAQKFRRKLIVGALGSSGAPQRLLDVGAGQGDFLRLASETWPSSELAGLEMSAAGVAAAGGKVPAAYVVQRDLLQQAEVDPLLDRWATHAVCSEVLEHVDDPSALLRNACEYLADGCRLVITVPAGPRSAFDKYIGHRRHFTRASLRSAIEGADLRIEHLEAAGFPVFNLYKLAVIARGKRLIDDIRRSDEQAQSASSGLAMRVFDGMFRFAPTTGRFGWQLVAVAVPRR